MFETIVSKITAVVRRIVRTVRETINQHSWLAPAAIIAFFLVR